MLRMHAALRSRAALAPICAADLDTAIAIMRAQVGNIRSGSSPRWEAGVSGEFHGLVQGTEAFSAI
jgi:hypothetical protein